MPNSIKAIAPDIDRILLIDTAGIPYFIDKIVLADADRDAILTQAISSPVAETYFSISCERVVPAESAKTMSLPFEQACAARPASEAREIRYGKLA